MNNPCITKFYRFDYNPFNQCNSWPITNLGLNDVYFSLYFDSKIL